MTMPEEFGAGLSLIAADGFLFRRNRLARASMAGLAPATANDPMQPAQATPSRLTPTNGRLGLKASSDD